MATVSQKFVLALKEIGVKYVFGVPSGNWVDYMEAIRKGKDIEFILVTNEASGGFMADVCWRLTGQIAACFGTFGPGACNLTTGVCGGFLDRSPMLVFTDEMSDDMIHRTTQMNIDHQKLFEPITKKTTRLQKGKEKEIIFEATRIALSEVPGPVHIGIPAGMGLDESPEEDIRFEFSETIDQANENEIQKMLNAFQKAEKPLVALGITSMRAGVRNEILAFIEKYKIPVVLTPMAKGMLKEDHPMYAGVLAHALGNKVGKIHQQADLVIGIGYDPIELNYEDWMPNVPLLHIDTVPADLNKENYTLAADVVGDIKGSLQQLLQVGCKPKSWNSDELIQNKNEMFEHFKVSNEVWGSRKVLEELREKLPENGIMVCDVGAHLHLIGQMWKTPSPECQLMTNGCSSMGFAMPAAIAAKLSCPEREVCCVLGDGSFAMMTGELLVAKRLNLKIVFVVLNDSELALIRIKQEKKGFEKYGTPLANTGQSISSSEMFGIPISKVHNTSDYEIALEQAFKSDGSSLIEAFIDSSEYNDLVLKGNK